MYIAPTITSGLTNPLTKAGAFAAFILDFLIYPLDPIEIRI